MAGIDDVVTKLQVGNQTMQQLVNVVTNIFPRSTGTFTMSAAASRTITDSNASTTSLILLMPTNAAAGTLQGSNKCLYVTRASGSFVVTTASGVAAAGTETFAYAIFNPL